jgi:serine phosphatase RsbU (regulator of sigma subunit)/anti-sigma regulatory factor (Ser/Thr protein kinase)
MSGPENPGCEEWTQVVIPPAASHIAPAVDGFCRAVASLGAAAGLVAGLRLAVTEAVTNSVKHAGLGPEDRIRLGWRWSGDWLTVEVAEPGHFVPPAGWTDLPADPLVESGRGGFLIAGQFDELIHLNHRGYHTLRLRKQLGPGVPRPAVEELEQTLDAMTEDLSTSYETLAALFKLAEALATTRTLSTFAGHALRLRDLIEADTMHVRLRNEHGELALLGVAAPGLSLPAGIEAQADMIEATVYRTGLERTIDDGSTLAPGDPLGGLTGPAFVCPVHFQTRPLGICVVSRREPGNFFTAAQISVARTTAEFLGIACANAELQARQLAQLRVQRELEIAAQIQQSLVPRDFPVRTDWTVHGSCVNALEAGGDFFDVLEVRDGVLLVIADVMGKGVPAALLAVVLRTAVRAHAPLAATPGDLLNRVSVQIAPDLERLGMFITAQAVFLGPQSRTLSYASAGHCPMVVLAADDGGHRFLDEGGLPLGVSAGEVYSASTATLAPGERLLLTTDGILEAPDDRGSELGLEGFAAMARDLRALPTQAFCSALLARIEARDAGRAPTDDRTLLAVHSLA